MLSLHYARCSSITPPLFGQALPRLFRRTLLDAKPGGPRRLTAEQVAWMVRSGDHIYCHSIAAYPRILVKALAARGLRERQHDSMNSSCTDSASATTSNTATSGTSTTTLLRDVSVYHLHVEGADDPLEDARISPQPFISRNFFVGRSSRAAVSEGRATYMPSFLSDIPTMVRTGAVRFDWAFLNLSPPDKHGFCSLGTEVCVALPAAQHARKLVAQINPNVPRVHGNSFIHWDALDYVVDVARDDPDAAVPEDEHVGAEPNDAALRIGQHIAAIVPDGATLQVGIGAIPNAVTRALRNHRHLGIHSELISDPIMELMRLNVITNLHKDFLAGRTVTSFIVGSRALYAFVNDNPGVHVDEATVTNRPMNIARNRNVVAINGAVEVDLTGQVCADSVGTRVISGVGGQLDFERGAALSEGGFPIICLQSQSKRGDSTIVDTLRPGAGVTTTRYHAHWIVTEYGAVNLWGLDLAQRAHKLIGIAHPSAREQLSKAAFARFKTLAR